MARKSPSFGQVLHYFNAPKKTGPAIFHNLRIARNDLKAIELEFLENSRLLPTRKNGNFLYHEVLSFSPLDRHRLTIPVLEDVTRRYFELRAPYALAYAKTHFDTNNPHVHILISANNIESRRRMRLSKKRFRQVQREVEEHQRKRYPLLSSSVVQASRSGTRFEARGR